MKLFSLSQAAKVIIMNKLSKIVKIEMVLFGRPLLLFAFSIGETCSWLISLCRFWLMSWMILSSSKFSIGTHRFSDSFKSFHLTKYSIFWFSLFLRLSNIFLFQHFRMADPRSPNKVWVWLLDNFFPIRYLNYCIIYSYRFQFVL